MSSSDVTGRWVGHYVQRGKEFPISAELSHVGDRLTGSMRDGQTDHENSVFEAVAAAGLPPGADEQVVARLRQMVPDAASGTVRSFARLPAGARLEGHVSGRTISFLKTYQGTSFGGYRVGDKLIGCERPGHSVHYEGQLTADGSTIAGRWWIDPGPETRSPRLEGEFRLGRVGGETRGPWWKFWP
jgi:hypothetical protein